MNRAMHSSWRTITYRVCFYLGIALASLLAGVGVVMKQDPKDYSDPVAASFITTVKAHAWLIVFVLPLVVIVLELVRKWVGEPWAHKALHKIMDKMRLDVFKIDGNDPEHDYRVTLFRYQRFHLWAWLFPHCGSRGWHPWSGWLVPVARSGIITQSSTSVFLAHDSGNVEGIPGLAWIRADTFEGPENLPALRKDSKDEEIKEYAERMWVEAGWIKKRLKAGKVCPLSFLGLRVECKGKPWGVLVLDGKKAGCISLNTQAYKWWISQCSLVLEEYLERA